MESPGCLDGVRSDLSSAVTLQPCPWLSVLSACDKRRVLLRVQGLVKGSVSAHWQCGGPRHIRLEDSINEVLSQRRPAGCHMWWNIIHGWYVIWGYIISSRTCSQTLRVLLCLLDPEWDSEVGMRSRSCCHEAFCVGYFSPSSRLFNCCQCFLSCSDTGELEWLAQTKLPGRTSATLR